MNFRLMPFFCVLSTLPLSILAVAQTTATPPPATAAPAAPAAAYKEGVIKVGSELKQTLGKVTDVEKGDNGCYLTLKAASGSELIELGKFELCRKKSILMGKQVALVFSMETIQAESCYGDPKCKKTATVPLVVDVKILN